MKSQGLKRAEGIVMGLTKGLAQSGGCYYEGRSRHDAAASGRQLTNAEVKDHLAKGNSRSAHRVERDINPTEEDGDKAARPFVLEVEKRLRLVRGPMTQASATMMVDAGWRKAGESGW